MDKLREADQRKDEFLATLAHELRNPLAPLTNALEIMNRADGDAAVLRQARQTMDRQLAQLVRLVDDLLDVSRITRNMVACAGSACRWRRSCTMRWRCVTRSPMHRE
jgi:signal transduction histidine kinase